MLDIREWLEDMGLGHHAQAFEANAVDVDLLKHLSDDDLKDLGVERLGERKRILLAAAGAGDNAPAPPARASEAPTAETPAGGGERRWLTVLFCDLVGSTSMSSRMEPEEFREIILGFQGTVAEQVDIFGGHLAKFMGDGVIAYFGFPSASENDVESALRASLAITRAISAKTAPDGAPLQVRAGIATGTVIVGDVIGFGEARERTVIGDAPNLASRLQDQAEPGTVLVTQDTHDLVAGRFVFEPKGEVVLKGFETPMVLHRVVEAVSHAPNRLLERPEDGDMVGRTREITRFLDAWTDVCASSSRGVLIEGEPGFGKSHFVRAMIDRLRPECFHLINQCSPYFRNEAFHPVVRRVMREAGIREDDPVEVQLDKLDAMERATGAPAQHLAWLCGIDGTARYGEMPGGAQNARATVVQELIDIVARASERRPVLLVYEDVHWSDPSTLELIRLSLEHYAEKRVMIVATARPGAEAKLSPLSGMERIQLGRLGDADVARLVQQRAGDGALSEAQIEGIRARSDGVPLFAKELTSTALQQASHSDGTEAALRVHDAAAAVPSTLRASLMARLDFLGEHGEVAQVASCIGRVFDRTVLARIAGRTDEELNSSLQALLLSEIVSPARAEDGGDFAFTHALVRDVAYDSLMLRRRRDIHAQILAILSEGSTGANDPLAQSIHHARKAEKWEEAVDLAVRAATAELEKSAYEEADDYVRSASTWLGRLPDTEMRQRKGIELDLFSRAALFPLGRHDEWRDRVEAAAIAAVELGDDLSLSHANGYLVTYHYIRRDHARAIRHGELGLEAAGRAGDLSARVNNSFNLSLPLVATGAFDRALALLTDVAELTEDDPSARHGLAGHPAVMALACSASIHAQRGERGASLASARRIEDLLGSDATSFTRIIGRVGIGSAEIAFGSLERALEILQAAFGESRRMSVWMLFSLSGGLLAEALLAARHLEQALQVVEAAVNPKLLAAMPVGFCYPLATQARILIELGRWEEADNVIDTAIERAEEIGERPYLGELHHARTLWESGSPLGDQARAVKARNACLAITSDLGMVKMSSAASLTQ
ncbi:AAA family ATPase [Ruegeria pomeroyi]|nr:AAA family ATPase [Ruegeria pomeroyi]